MEINFYSKENLLILMKMCKNYMQDKYDIDIFALEGDNYKKTLLFIMNTVYDKNNNRNSSIRDLNIEVLSRAIIYYKKRYAPAGSSAEQYVQTNLDRDKNNRKLIINEISNNNLHSDNKHQLPDINRMIERRDIDINGPKRMPDIKELGMQISDVAPDKDDFMEKLKLLQLSRSRINGVTNNENNVFNRMEVDRQIKNKIENIDAPLRGTAAHPKMLYQPITKPNTQSDNLASQSAILTTQPGSTIRDNLPGRNGLMDVFPNERSENIIARNNKHYEIEKYIDINSADRDWKSDMLRCQYKVNFQNDDNDIQMRYKNIRTIEINSVIIPQDTINGIINDSNTNRPYRPYNYQFSLSLPFVYLSIDEFRDMYDGTNPTIRKAFTKMIVDKTFNTPENNRNYTVLKTAQKEKKVFYPALLSSLNRLSISLLKPNGDLINYSNDNYNIKSVQYDATKNMYLEITLYRYFDDNEFNLNDTIIIKDYNMTKLTNDMDSGRIEDFNNFMNKSGGHLIVHKSNQNTQGYYNQLYIMAPNHFDSDNGTVNIDHDTISMINLYNSRTFPGNGVILNFSLQNSISMSLGIVVDDARILDIQDVFSM